MGREIRFCISKKLADDSDAFSQWTIFCEAKFLYKRWSEPSDHITVLCELLGQAWIVNLSLDAFPTYDPKMNEQPWRVRVRVTHCIARRNMYEEAACTTQKNNQTQK